MTTKTAIAAAEPPEEPQRPAPFVIQQSWNGNATSAVLTPQQGSLGPYVTVQWSA